MLYAIRKWAWIRCLIDQLANIFKRHTICHISQAISSSIAGPEIEHLSQKLSMCKSAMLIAQQVWSSDDIILSERIKCIVWLYNFGETKPKINVFNHLWEIRKWADHQNLVWWLIWRKIYNLLNLLHICCCKTAPKQVSSWLMSYQKYNFTWL